jgi:hypothetical protein
MKKFRVTVFEKHRYEVAAQNREEALNQVLSGNEEKIDAELDGTDVEEIR